MTDLSAEFKALASYRPQHKVRFVTAASLFDGHDAAINIMRRILQGMGAEVIHLGHNRSVEDVVRAALQEDADGIALDTSALAQSVQQCVRIVAEGEIPHIDSWQCGHRVDSSGKTPQL